MVASGSDSKMGTHKTDSHLGVSIIGSMVMVMKRVEGSDTRNIFQANRYGTYQMSKLTVSRTLWYVRSFRVSVTQSSSVLDNDSS